MLSIVYNQTMPFTMPIVQQCQMCDLFLPSTTSLCQDQISAKLALHACIKGIVLTKLCRHSLMDDDDYYDDDVYCYDDDDDDDD